MNNNEQTLFEKCLMEEHPPIMSSLMGTPTFNLDSDKKVIDSCRGFISKCEKTLKEGHKTIARFKDERTRTEKEKEEARRLRELEARNEEERKVHLRNAGILAASFVFLIASILIGIIVVFANFTQIQFFGQGAMAFWVIAAAVVAVIIAIIAIKSMTGYGVFRTNKVLRYVFMGLALVGGVISLIAIPASVSSNVISNFEEAPFFTMTYSSIDRSSVREIVITDKITNDSSVDFTSFNLNYHISDGTTTWKYTVDFSGTLEAHSTSNVTTSFDATSELYDLYQADVSDIKITYQVISINDHTFTSAPWKTSK